MHISDRGALLDYASTAHTAYSLLDLELSTPLGP